MAFAKLSGALLARKDTPAALTLAELVSVPVSRPPDLPPPSAPTATPKRAAAAAAARTPAPPDAETQQALAHHLEALKLPMFLREYDKLARECAEEGLDPAQFLLRLAELEVTDREQQNLQRRIRAAQFPALKTLDTFDFTAVPSL